MRVFAAGIDADNEASPDAVLPLPGSSRTSITGLGGHDLLPPASAGCACGNRKTERTLNRVKGR